MFAGNGVQRWLQQVHAVLNGSSIAERESLPSYTQQNMTRHKSTKSSPSFLPSSRSPTRRRAWTLPRMLTRRFYSQLCDSRSSRRYETVLDTEIIRSKRNCNVNINQQNYRIRQIFKLYLRRSMNGD